MISPSTLLVVNDLTESKRFYTQVLGFKVEEAYPERVRLSYGGHHVFMFQGTAGAVDYDHGVNANETLILPVSDLDAKIRQLKALGVCFIHQVPSENPWGRYAAFKDPSGIVLEIMQFNSQITNGHYPL
ncbi:VOC family protein [Thalassotalea ganghwensis]